MKRLFLLSILLFCSVLLFGCCNFASLEGNGTRSRAVYAAYLPAATPYELNRMRYEADAGDVTLIFNHGPYAGYQTKLSSGFDWWVPVGPYRERSFWEPNKKQKGHTLCIKLDSLGTTAFPVMAGQVKVYNYFTGQCLAFQRYIRIGLIPLAVYESSLTPVKYNRLIPGSPNVLSPEALCGFAVSLEGIKPERSSKYYFWPPDFFHQPRYERLTSYYFLWGLLAFGQKNERAYMQLAWIPIELWSLEK